MPQLLRILLVENDPNDLELIKNELHVGNIAADIIRVETEEETRRQIETYIPDVILCDFNLPRMNGFTALQIRNKIAPRIPFILVTGSVGEETAVDCIKAGADDYILKDRLKRLVQAIRSALERRILLEEKEKVEKEVRLLLSITRAMNEVSDFPSAIRVALEQVCEIAGWSYAEAWIPRSDGSALDLSPMWFGKKEEMEKLRSSITDVTFPSGIGLPGRVWKSKRPEWVSDVSVDTHIFLRAKPMIDAGLKAGLAVPLTADDHVLAVFAYFLTDIREEDKRMVEIVSNVAAQLGTALRKKQAEDALRESEMRFRQIAEQIHEVFFIANADVTQVLYLSPSFENVWGSSRESVYRNPRSWLDAIHPADKDVFYQSFQRSFETHQLTEEHRIIRPDGSVRWMLTRAFPVYSTEGTLARWVGIVEDISERKEIEHALKESEEKYRSLVDHALVGVFQSTTEGKILYINEAIVRMSEFDSVEEMMQQPSALLYENPEERTRVIQKLKAFGRIDNYEIALRTKSGKIKYYIFSASLIDTVISGTILDITERKLAEKLLWKSNEELRSLSLRLVESEETERRRLARELHDRVGQNLTALSINMNIIRDAGVRALDVVEMRRIDDSLSLIDETAETIRDVMADLRPTVLDDYGLASALRSYGDLFSERTKTRCEFLFHEPVARFDPSIETVLYRIAQEALNNIAKHAHAACATIELDVTEEMIQLNIIDDGRGFTPEEIPTQEGKKGLGLTTMRERVESIGGRLRIHTEANRGTRISVEVKR